MIYQKCAILIVSNQSRNSILYSIQELLVNFKPDVLCLSFLFHFSYLILLADIFHLHAFYASRGEYAYFGAIDRSKLREEFLIYLDNATRFFPHRKTPGV